MTIRNRVVHGCLSCLFLDSGTRCSSSFQQHLGSDRSSPRSGIMQRSISVVVALISTGKLSFYIEWDNVVIFLSYCKMQCCLAEVVSLAQKGFRQWCLFEKHPWFMRWNDYNHTLRSSCNGRPIRRVVCIGPTKSVDSVRVHFREEVCILIIIATNNCSYLFSSWSKCPICHVEQQQQQQQHRQPTTHF